MSALARNNDLVPGSDGLVGKRQTYEAMLRVGIAEKVARETTDANFQSLECPTCPDRIDLLNMNTIRGRSGRSPEGQPHEHFRSTGIRDHGEPIAFIFDMAVTTCVRLFGAMKWTLKENLCMANLWDCGCNNCCEAAIPDLDVRIAARYAHDRTRMHSRLSRLHHPRLFTAVHPHGLASRGHC